MNFYYDPVLGLQYSFDDNQSFCIIDLAMLPKDFDINEWMYHWRKTGIPIYNSVPKTELEYTPKITSNISFL